MIRLLGLGLRWLLFIPISLTIAEYIEVFIIQFFHKILPDQILFSFLIYFVAATLSCIIFLSAGTFLAPIRNKITKVIIGIFMLLIAIHSVNIYFSFYDNPFQVETIHAFKYGLLIKGIIGAAFSIYFFTRASNRFFYRN